MRDPVLCADGHSYERAAITAWLAKENTSPLDGSPLAHVNLIPNYTLRSLISACRAAGGAGGDNCTMTAC